MQTSIPAPIRRGHLLIVVALLGTALVSARWLRSRHPPRTTEPASANDKLTKDVATGGKALVPAAPTGSVSTNTARPLMPMRAVPCVEDTRTVTLNVLETDPVVCTATTCLRLQERSVTVVDAPPAPTQTLAATVRTGADHPAACRDTTCKPFGPRLRAAVALEAAQESPALEATLDLTAVVVGTQIWSVARDRPLVLQRPQYGARDGVGGISVVGDLLLVKWEGSCVDSLCRVSQLVDREGREQGWVEAGGRVLRLDEHQVVMFSEFSSIEIRDLHTGKQISSFDPRVNSGDFIDAVRLGDGRFATLRDLTDGVHVEVFEAQEGYGPPLARSDLHMFLPDCEI